MPRGNARGSGRCYHPKPWRGHRQCALLALVNGSCVPSAGGSQRRTSAAASCAPYAFSVGTAEILGVAGAIGAATAAGKRQRPAPSFWGSCLERGARGVE